MAPSSSPAYPQYHRERSMNERAKEETSSMANTNALPEDTLPVPVADGVTLLDLGFQGIAGAIGTYLLSGGDEVALLEVGPGSTRDTLERMVNNAGYAMD